MRAHLRPTGPRWAPRWPHQHCYLGYLYIKFWFFVAVLNVVFWKSIVNVFITSTPRAQPHRSQYHPIHVYVYHEFTTTNLPIVNQKSFKVTMVWNWLVCFFNNSLRPSDAYMRQLANPHWFRLRFIAWPAPSHCLNQCRNIVNWTIGNKLNRNLHILIQENVFRVSSGNWQPFCLGLGVLKLRISVWTDQNGNTFWRYQRNYVETYAIIVHSEFAIWISGYLGEYLCFNALSRYQNKTRHVI